MATISSGDLLKRVESLGRLVVRGDIERWIEHLDSTGPTERAALVASFEDPAVRKAAVVDPAAVELVRIVDAYGGEQVLKAVEQAAAEFRRAAAARVTSRR